MTIDTVIFDFGGVLYNTPAARSFSRWLRILGIKEDPQAMAMIYDPSSSPLFWNIMRGKMSEQEMWIILARQWKIPPALIGCFQRSMISRKRLNKPMAEYLTAIRSKYKTGILSNAGDEFRKTMENTFKFDQLVNMIIISAEEGYAKPDSEIYQIAIDRFNTSAENCVFVDDLIENVEAAQALGMHAIHHQNNDETIRKLDQVLKGKL